MRSFTSGVSPGAARSVSPALPEIAARLVDPAPEVARLSAGQFLRGQVVGQDDAGLLLIQTKLAIVKLAAARSLAVGSEVILQVRAGGTQAGLSVIPVEGAGPAPTAGDDIARPAVVSGPAGPAPRPGVAAALTADLISNASLLRAVLQTAPPLPLLAGLPSAEPGSELLLRILAIATPQAGATLSAGGSGTPGNPGGVQGPAGTGPQGVGLQAGAPGPTTSPAGAGQQAAVPGQSPASPGGGGGPGGGSIAGPSQQASNTSGLGTATGEPGLKLAPQTSAIGAGRSVAAVLQGVTASGAAQAAGATAPGATAAGATSGAANAAHAGAPEAGAQTQTADGRTLRLTGLVTGKAAGAPTILHTPLGSITLKAPIDLPAGSSLSLEVLLPEGSRPPPLLPGLSAAWPTAEALEEMLFANLPPSHSEALLRALPQVGPRLGSGLLFFLSAINQGNPLAWLAAPAAALERGERGDFIERLGRELAGLSRNVEAAGGDWRLFQIPVWSDQGLRELRLFFRHHDGGGQAGEAGDESATRFVLELDLKRHGELQLDGLVRGQQFDLILRSRRHLSPLLRADLLALFEETNAIAGYRGRLVFQTSQDWEQVHPAPRAGALEPVLEV
ncbi:hypothetical protein [Pelagibius sp.]|uniref:hypothetical protein n=1 Tax=Pelagibius sp. TaxID=1931238 RepID=UPI0026255F7F|nr:hypothetical protein [Pelagibius sp.]